MESMEGFRLADMARAKITELVCLVAYWKAA